MTTLLDYLPPTKYFSMDGQHIKMPEKVNNQTHH